MIYIYNKHTYVLYKKNDTYEYINKITKNKLYD